MAGLLLSPGPEAMTETRHQMLQRSLAERDRGGPHEQIRSAPHRLQGTRGTDIVHSSLHEPLSTWKSLEPHKPHWPSTWRRYHLNHGIRVVDNDTVVVSARDKVQRTQQGLLRSSSGSATYSQTQRQKAEIEVAELAEIMAGSDVPWTPKKLEHIFKERHGRIGVWGHYDLGMRAFLSCFPKTFEIYGKDGEFVRLRRARNSTVLDHGEDAMRRLARARSHGFLQREPSPRIPNKQHPDVGHNKTKVTEPLLALPSLKSNRLKVAFTPHEDPSEHFGMFRD